MKLTVVPVKIAKSITLLVTSPVDGALRRQTAGWLLRRDPPAHRVAFLAWDGDTPLLDTANGELDLDSAMALSAALAEENRLPTGETWDFPLSLLSHLPFSLPCSVTPVHTCCLVTVTLPPAEISTVSLDGFSLTQVTFPGASYLIAPAGSVSRSSASALLRCHSGAAGLLLWNKEALLMEPLIQSGVLDAAAWLPGCAGGAAAIGAYLAGSAGQTISLRQEGGAIAVTRTDEGAVTVTAPVEPGHPRSVDVVF